MFDFLNMDIFLRLLNGLYVTLQISVISIIISCIGGLVLGVMMSLNNKIIYIFLRFGLELIRIMPLIVWLFVVYFGLSRWFDLNLSAINSTIVVFSIWGVFEMMDLVRGALQSIPKHQFQSGLALGFNTLELYVYIIIPQAIRRLIPACINLLTRMIKSTTFAFLIGAIELVKVGQQIIEFYHKENLMPFIIYGLIFFVYFMICYPLSLYSKKLEKKWS